MAIYLDTEVQYIKGVGPKLGDVLRKRGVSTVGDLLEWFPRAYEDRRAARSISSLEPDQIVCLTAHILNVRSMNMGRSHRKIYEVMVGDKTGRIPCKFFRVPYKGYFERFRPYQEVKVSGKVTFYRGQLQFQHPEIHPLVEGEEQEDSLMPLYTETEGIRPTKLRKIIGTAIYHLIEEKNKEPRIIEPLPQWVLDKYRLLGKSDALKGVHIPPNHSADDYLNFRSPAQRRIIFDEFFWMELHLAQVRSGIQKEAAPPMELKLAKVNELKKSLPFQLTGAQDRSFQEIVKDLQQPHPMHRLVQGDVGSGKTLVALLSALFVADNGFQSALMVPTEILADQHYKNAKKLLEPLGLKVCLLTGSLKEKEKREIAEKIKAGEFDVCVGTHALIQDEVFFNKLGLVVIDEQHRFGVEQRKALKKDGSPHFLVMTATPIPRTLAMTVYGDLDVSVIDEMPPGRTPIVTRSVFDSKRPKVMGFLKEQIQKGRQAYIVYPLVEESDKMELKDAVTQHERIQKEFPEFKIGLLHGKMKPQEKDEVMKSFRAGDIQVLVSTTVIEVGVDVPNATLMIIEHAERFGLSQLHQLRGRVGRGKHKSYCVLLLGYAVSEESKTRAQIMEKTSDGFKIAEADLEIRGPGEFLGRRQSGLPGFKMANLVRDTKILQDARQAAFELIKRDPDLKQPEYQTLKEQLEKNQADLVG